MCMLEHRHACVRLRVHICGHVCLCEQTFVEVDAG